MKNVKTGNKAYNFLSPKIGFPSTNIPNWIVVIIRDEIIANTNTRGKNAYHWMFRAAYESRLMEEMETIACWMMMEELSFSSFLYTRAILKYRNEKNMAR